ncbi:MAG: YhgE/Pip domain-containing protein, partial [Clostridia bacterium]
MKKILSVLLICALLSAFIYPVQAATQEQSSQKEEIIYAVLDNDGKVSEVYVVNSFKTENIVDYGDYIKIKNLSTTDKITVEDDLITVSTDQDSFYYQGYLESRELPWTIQITYLLDNEAITADDLAGKSGKIDILINIEPNTAADSFFFSNYTLSVSLKLDERLCNNIEAPKAVIATAGMYKQLTYTILPDKK